ncbi:MAG TPA: RNA polymerase subunit sigma-70 [Polyangiales bacterium]|nr:RNA polymerase subunit sigma-70 [Polyangiales bacterium]
MRPSDESKSKDQFASETQSYRRELLAHCYRMLGSAQEAEDLVQETYLRAFRAYEGFEGNASMRSWLYTIATNVCLSALASRRSRVLPSGLTASYEGPERPAVFVPPGEVSWLEPLPDAWTEVTVDDPGTIAIERESLRLALIASLQYLAPRQRAIFLLREVLAFSAEEAAQILATSTPAIKSGLQRARARLDEVMPKREALLQPTDPRALELLNGYIAAFERSDANLLLSVLRADATLEATPFRDWVTGRAKCIQLLEKYVLGAPGDWRMLVTRANGQPAAALYRRDANGALTGYGLVVLAATDTGVASVVAFHDPALVKVFGFSDSFSRDESKTSVLENSVAGVPGVE